MSDQDTTPDTDDRDVIGEATYSVEDNKFRLYPFARLDSETYERVKAAGFKWAPKQELFVAGRWTPAREDLLIELCGEVGDEDYSPEDRSADRAERFSGYRDRRAGEAIESADRFDSGPAAFGHQNRARAERAARRHDRHRTYGVRQWDKAEYWQDRTRAVIAHALFKSSVATRRGRLLKIESDLRATIADSEEYAARFRRWEAVASMEGADTPIEHISEPNRIGLGPGTTPAGKAAYALANSGRCYGEYIHPRTGLESSLYGLLTDKVDPITPAEAAALWLHLRERPDDPDSYSSRWRRHYENRITYERAMIDAEGGMASELEMEPGGWIGAHQIHKVNRSPVTGRVVSVAVMGTKTEYTRESGYRTAETRPALVTYKVERLGENAYRPPTDEEREAFKASQKAAKAERKATAPKAPPLINPTDEDAQRLQDEINARFPNEEPVTVLRITQAVYSANSKGDYSRASTAEINEHGRIRTIRSRSREVVYKVRIAGSGYSPCRVIVLTDKPQKPIPWEAVAAARRKCPTADTIRPALARLAEIMRQDGWKDSEEDKAILADAEYVGWVIVASMSQRSWTAAGLAELATLESANVQ